MAYFITVTDLMKKYPYVYSQLVCSDLFAFSQLMSIFGELGLNEINESIYIILNIAIRYKIIPSCRSNIMEYIDKYRNIINDSRMSSIQKYCSLICLKNILDCVSGKKDMISTLTEINDLNIELKPIFLSLLFLYQKCSLANCNLNCELEEKEEHRMLGSNLLLIDDSDTIISYGPREE